MIYGPYSTDFSEPAEYEVTLVMRGLGLPEPRELQQDLILLRLDITRTTQRFFPAVGGGVAGSNTITTVARRYIRASELARARWREISIRFYASGEGLWEYVILAFDGISEKPNNIATFGEHVRLFFDRVIIRRRQKMVIPSS